MRLGDHPDPRQALWRAVAASTVMWILPVLSVVVLVVAWSLHVE